MGIVMRKDNIKNMPKNYKGNTIKGRKNKRRQKPAVRILKIIGTIILSLFLIVVITGSILATALTIYILNFADSSNVVSLENVQMSYTTRLLANNPDYDKNDKDSEKYALYYSLSSNGEKRTWVDYSDIPKHVCDAFVCSEDERFNMHDGVDFKRTFASFANLLLHFYDTRQGGSTITQQTIKNITGDSATDGSEGIARKIREIFRSINVEKAYTKQEILEAYLNIVPLGNNVAGVQAAANFYFGKDVSELSIKEAASLAAITPSPVDYNPYDNYDENVGRTNDYNLKCMLNNGAISTNEYEEALAEKLVITGDKDYTSDNTVSVGKYQNTGVTSYYVDATLDEAVDRIAEYDDISTEEAEEKLNAGGYTINTNVNLNMQSKVEKKYLDASNFTNYTLSSDKLQSAFIAMDYKGRVRAVVGGRGKKKVSRSWNIATMSARQPGSSIKPIASYAPALDKDLITWSTIFNDKPITITKKDNTTEKWPINYSEYGGTSNWSYNNYFTFEMIYRSLNTAPAQIVEKLTPSYSYNFLQNTLHISTLDINKDPNYSPMVVGALTNGLILEELVAAYEMFGNGGQYFEPTFISKMVDREGNVIYENKYEPEQAIDKSTAFVMNRMMQTVITNSNGTGRYARLSNVDLVGKTGTSDKWHNLTFVSCSPSYVSGVWVGYAKKAKQISSSEYQNIGAIWRNVFGDIANSSTKTDFDVPDNVQQLKYCRRSGLIAGSNCWSTATGWYKASNIPAVCTSC